MYFLLLGSMLAVREDIYVDIIRGLWKFFCDLFCSVFLPLYFNSVCAFFYKKAPHSDMKFSMVNKVIKEVIKTMGFNKKMSIEVRS